MRQARARGSSLTKRAVQFVDDNPTFFQPKKRLENSFLCVCISERQLSDSCFEKTF